MTNIIEPKTLPGFRDFLPEQMAIRKRVIGILEAVFEKYGFQPLETPALEYQDILLGKYGEEAERLIYLFSDRGERDVGLKYDLTVPLARVIAQYPNLPRPFKRYQIQTVWRAEKPQKGRYREFTQCDVDIVGSSSPLADAEIIAIMYDSLKALGFKKFRIRINSRQVLFKILEEAGAPKDRYLTILQSVDKLDKKTPDEVRVELAEKLIPNSVVEMVFTLLKSAKPNENLGEILGLLGKLGVDEKYYVFDPVLSRGLDYYTGAVFETVVEEPKIGSIIGGGRYDKLIGSFTGVDISTVGTSFGLDRIVDVICELNLWPKVTSSATKVLVTIFSPDLLDKSLDVVKRLRSIGISAEIYLDTKAKLDKQLKYADEKKIPFAIILGPDEVKKNLVTVKDLRSQTQVTKKLADVIKLINADK